MSISDADLAAAKVGTVELLREAQTLRGKLANEVACTHSAYPHYEVYPELVEAHLRQAELFIAYIRKHLGITP